ncbi:P-loop containing nucleoside triphosphate hydrolase [Glarea lozoyensis ATCC 20868]|uniref:p-loop containing nucleoside triphosphate hydrolase n=1 Tax=Glarea lozoyensis (strain ATCC 20868 / MF5171) TaxID=1116229 RepID=S3D0X8_GLAL2|nr:P-loop containing nucleoside triphosphate hydrolase [Glarea lozoyensis ATCC 20868]EPE25681.1 P-loop containing nucleoside triphosphate hydrolase [Glarea lozoyensis ATCC 20868]
MCFAWKFRMSSPERSMGLLQEPHENLPHGCSVSILEGTANIAMNDPVLHSPSTPIIKTEQNIFEESTSIPQNKRLHSSAFDLDEAYGDLEPQNISKNSSPGPRESSPSLFVPEDNAATTHLPDDQDEVLAKALRAELDDAPTSKLSCKQKVARKKGGKSMHESRLVQREKAKKKTENSSPARKKQKKSEVLDANCDGSETITRLLQHDPTFAVRPKIAKAPDFLASNRKTQLSMQKKFRPEKADIKQFGIDQSALKKSLSYLGRHHVRIQNDKYLMKGMKTALYAHQMIGVQWMIERENPTDISGGPRGGILADSMGVGKTLQALAPPPDDVSQDRKITLIVVPSALKLQWLKEIKKHAGPLKVMIYKASLKLELWQITDCDIMITSWNEVSASCPYPDATIINELRGRTESRKKKGNPEEDESTPIEEWIEQHREEGGLLHQIKFHRVILDESHNMKNHLSRRSLAACTLMTDRPWAMSGLTSSNELDQLLCKTMLHRKPTDIFLGRPIVDLPDAHEYIRILEHGREEKLLYRAFEDRLRELMNEYLDPEKATDEQKNLHGEANKGTAALEVKHLKGLEKKLLALNSPEDITILNKVQDWIKEKELAERRPAWQSANEAIDAQKEAQCSLCFESADQFHKVTIKKCSHIFCDDCMDNEIASLEGTDPDCEGVILCPKCDTPFEPAKHLKPWSPKNSRRNPTVHRKGKDFLQFHPKITSYTWAEKYDRGIPIMKSAKTQEMTMIIKTLLTETPEEKIIIFTQWRGFAAIAGRMLEEMGCQFVYFTGDKAPEKRNIAVNTFESDPNVNVMIAGLGCGGVGLNLAFANRVINIDLWWNVCLEQQAFGRVHRMPQQRETHFAKLIVNNTIDSRIYEKQLDKQSIIDPKMKKLTKYEMASLLGKVVTDENGRKRVVSDYDDEKDEHSAGNGHDNDDDIPIYDLGSDSDDEDYREL